MSTGHNVDGTSLLGDQLASSIAGGVLLVCQMAYIHIHTGTRLDWQSILLAVLATTRQQWRGRHMRCSLLHYIPVKYKLHTSWGILKVRGVVTSVHYAVLLLFPIWFFSIFWVIIPSCHTRQQYPIRCCGVLKSQNISSENKNNRRLNTKNKELKYGTNLAWNLWPYVSWGNFAWGEVWGPII